VSARVVPTRRISPELRISFLTVVGSTPRTSADGRWKFGHTRSWAEPGIDRDWNEPHVAIHSVVVLQSHSKEEKKESPHYDKFRNRQNP
jgi:hypothetical protein